MRWLEHCAEWCCAGWQFGVPRFSQIVGEGCRLFAESISTREARLEFQRSLVAALWTQRDSTASLHAWLSAMKTEIIAGHVLKGPHDEG